MSLNVGTIHTNLNIFLNSIVGRNAPKDKQIVTSPIIKARAGGTRPDFPLIMTDRMGIQNYGIDGVKATYHDELGRETRESDHKLPFIISVLGGINDDVESKAHAIRKLLWHPEIRSRLVTATNCDVLSISDVEFASVYLNTNYQETARIIVTLVTEDIDVTDYSGDIENIEQTGELSGNDSILTIDVTTNL